MLQNNKLYVLLITRLIAPHLTKEDPAWNLLVELLLTNPQELYNDNLAHSEVVRKWQILNQNLEMGNLLQHFYLFEQLYRIIVKYFSNLSNHQQHKTIKYAIDKNNFDLISLLWAMSMFNAIVGAQPVITIDDTTVTKLLSVIVEQASQQLGLLWLAIVEPTTTPSILTLKKYTHIFLHELNTEETSPITIRVEEKTKMLSIQDFFNEKTPDPVTNKVTVIDINIKFESNNHRRYNISDKPATLLTINGNSYSYNSIIFNIAPLILQRYNRNKTHIEPPFLTAVQQLANTQFYIEEQLMFSFADLIKNNLHKTWEEINKITSLKVHNNLDAKLLLGKTTRLVYSRWYVRQALQQILMCFLKSYDNAATLASLAKKTSINSRLLGSIFAKHKSESELIREAQQLQVLFSEAYFFESYLNYFEYINNYSIKYVFFQPYADFRGRLYYKSEASPQSIWCFRFIYSYEPKKTALLTNYPLYPYQETFLEQHPALCKNRGAIEFIQAIGVLFKSKCINPTTGAMPLEEILKLGYEQYNKYKDTPIQDAQADFDLRDLAELYYYIYAFKHEREAVHKGFYIWKDTTASVIQHGGKLLGYKHEYLHLLNLNNNLIAYDTYQCIINKIKEVLTTQGVYPPEVIELLNRKALKQLIMTCEYQVSYQTAYKSYTHCIAELALKNPTYNNLLNNNFFKDIFKLLKTGLVASLFFQQTPARWFQRGNNQMESSVDIRLDTTYYKNAYTTLYYDKGTEQKRERATSKTLLPSWENQAGLIHDTRKIKQAAYVNFIHAYDAVYLRAICRLAADANIELAAIHDGFGVAYYNSKWLISAANEAFWPASHVTHSFSHTILI